MSKKKQKNNDKYFGGVEKLEATPEEIARAVLGRVKKNREQKATEDVPVMKDGERVIVDKGNKKKLKQV